MNNFTFMTTKIRYSKMLYLVLLVSFLSLQWSSAHIHLAEHHDHDGTHHQHEIEKHTHHQTLSADNFNFHSIDDSDKLVELDLDCNRYATSKYDIQCIVFSSVNNQLSVYYQVGDNEPPVTHNSKLRYIDYSTIQFRGPPKIS